MRKLTIARPQANKRTEKRKWTNKPDTFDQISTREPVQVHGRDPKVRLKDSHVIQGRVQGGKEFGMLNQF